MEWSLIEDHETLGLTLEVVTYIKMSCTYRWIFYHIIEYDGITQSNQPHVSYF